MGKAISLTLAVALILALAGCTTTGAPSSSSTTSQSDTASAPLNVGGNVTQGLGVVTSVSGSKDAGADKEGAAQTNTTICSVVFDADGKIKSISIDVAQAYVNFDDKGKITTDIAKPVKTKKQKGDDYGMKTASPIKKEWFEQIDALEKWMVGKSVNDVVNMPTTKKDDAHTKVPDVAELKSSCTIDVGEIIEALQMAKENAK